MLDEQVAALIRDAAVDGLSLETVYADLRLVLGLAPCDELPAALVRSCALTWARANESVPVEDEVAATGSRGELEDRLWQALLAGGPESRPLLLVVAPAAHDAGSTVLRLLGGIDGLVRLTAGLLATEVVPPAETVVRWSRADGAPYVVALVTGPDADARVARVRRRVDELLPGSPLRFGVHPLDGGAGGRLAAVRQALEAAVS